MRLAYPRLKHFRYAISADMDTTLMVFVESDALGRPGVRLDNQGPLPLASVLKLREWLDRFIEVETERQRREGDPDPPRERRRRA